ncbi:hypothetical protein FACS1894159_06420 [Bacteroidia bacterium]|nr:hypothetical protein FACS1894159_06420 [Bacteroidia bacterium]
MVAVATAGGQAYLTDPRYGDTPAQRQKNAVALSLFMEECNARSYDRALGHLWELTGEAPRISQNIYLLGANIYRSKIAAAATSDERDRLLDALMSLYDRRAAAFADLPADRGKGYILSLKARDYYACRPDDVPGNLRLFDDALTQWGMAADPDFANICMKIVTDWYAADKVTPDVVLAGYDRLAPLFEAPGVETTGDDRKRAEARKTFDALLAGSGAADCDNLERLFKPRVDASPDDRELMGRVFAAMTRAGCRSDFYFALAERYYTLAPSSPVALALGAAFEQRKDYARALKYLGEAVAGEKDPVVISSLQVRIAANLLEEGKAREAARAARAAMEANPENGYGPLMLAQACAAGASACSGFDRHSVSWLVVDLLTEARSRLMADADAVSAIDRQVASFSRGFPGREECFFRGVRDGDQITVGCGWITGRTTVREGGSK